MLPVVSVSGPCGVGKTTLLKHLLSSSGRVRVAVITNDISEVSIDGQAIWNARADDENKVVELTNGCICCCHKSEFLGHLLDLANRGCNDCVLVELASTCKNSLFRELFTSSSSPLKNQVFLTRMVAVVDLQMMSELQLTTETLRHGEALQFTKQLKKRLHLVDQIRNADEIILNKCDLMSQDLISQFRVMLNQINAHAPIHETISANVDTEVIVGSIFRPETPVPEVPFASPFRVGRRPDSKRQTSRLCDAFNTGEDCECCV